MRTAGVAVLGIDATTAARTEDPVRIVDADGLSRREEPRDYPAFPWASLVTSADRPSSAAATRLETLSAVARVRSAARST